VHGLITSAGVPGGICAAANASSLAVTGMFQLGSRGSGTPISSANSNKPSIT
jgi:hypothetical protein